MTETTIFAENALLPEGFAANCRVTVVGTRIETVEAGAAPMPGDERVAILIPGMANLHSHAFQRAMAGLAEIRGPGHDTFWTWRDIMYRVALALSPEEIEAVAAQLYAEMLEGGFTRVGEFHYLHHKPDGAPYDDIARLAGAISSAAADSGIGMTLIKAEDWLTHPGSVGKAIHGTLHVCDAEGEEVPAGQDGLLYFENDLIPTYHNDPEKTREAMHPKGWMTLGDIGHVDEDGFLYLTDRKSHMIISGGVNIYPQEIENLLVTHDKVMDAAVIGAPCPDFGEKVVAVVQPIDMADAGDALEAELRDFLAPSLSKIKMPKLFDFRAQLPREANGKLYKRELRDEYQQQAEQQTEQA